MPRTKAELESIFTELKKLIQKHSKGLVEMTMLPGSKAKEQRTAFHIMGKEPVAIGNRKPQQTYVVGIMLHKNFVGFYSMPLYSHPKEVEIQNNDVAKMRKGKSCINVDKLSTAILKELERLVKEGNKIYKKEGWI